MHVGELVIRFVSDILLPLHLMHRTGPDGPKSLIGGSFSPSSMRANGDITNPKGTPLCFRISSVDGTWYIVERIYL